MNWSQEFDCAGLMIKLSWADDKDRSVPIEPFVQPSQNIQIGPRANYDLFVGPVQCGWLILKFDTANCTLFGRLTLQQDVAPLREEYFSSGKYWELIRKFQDVAFAVQPFKSSYFEIPYLNALVIGEGRAPSK
jgi:hypothetical protein